MANLMAAAAFFLGIHFGVSGTRLRDRLVGRVGEKAFRGLFALTSIAGLIWLIRAYSSAPHIRLWGRLVVLEPLAPPLMLAAVVFVVLGLITPGPTTAGMEAQLARDVQVRGITRITRHPFLWGTALWASVHFVINGNLASSITFGSLLVLAVAGTTSIDAKRRRAYGDRWESFAQQTSNVPFLAIIERRNNLTPAVHEVGIVRPALAIVVFAALFLLHGRLFGAPLT
jgi:uncharacterized membrane protein